MMQQEANEATEEKTGYRVGREYTREVLHGEKGRIYECLENNAPDSLL